jgi:hypothetical protein
MKASRVGSLVAAIALAGVIAYFALREPEPMPPPAPVATAPEAPTGAAEPGTEPPIRHPIEAAEPAPQPDASSLPALDESDAAVGASVAGLFAESGTPDVLLLKDIVRRVVVTVDNLPRERVARRLSPLKPAEGGLQVSRQGDDLVIGDANRGRYAPFVKLVETVDIGYLAALYRRFYPLFQQAYQELGYPRGYFNDRLIAVIDHLLATPEPAGPLRLVQPKVLYQFADPELERLSAGQKYLLRMAPDDAARIKARLREFRGHVAGGRAARE